jgi:hypothetical protein
MKLKIVLVALFVAGFAASLAVAKPPPAGSTAQGKKVLMCHKTASGRYVLVRVSKHSAIALKKSGDLPAVDGSCAGLSTTTGSTDTTGTTDTTPTTTTTG